jgi:hypothetical protein
MRGEFDLALKNVEKQLAETSATIADVVALAMFKAELFYLNREEAKAIATLKEYVIPNKGNFPPSVQCTIDGNYVTSQFAIGMTEGVDLFSQMVDVRRQIGFEWLDHQDIFESQKAIDSGRLASAADPIWRMIHQSYRHGYWKGRQDAESRFARLSLKIGDLESAAHYAISALEDEELDELAEGVISRRDVCIVRSIAKHVMTFANLDRHFIVGAELLGRIHDVMPDDLVDPVARWLLQRCSRDRSSMVGTSASTVAWETVEKYGSRISSETATSLLKAAIGHPTWVKPTEPNRFALDRDIVVEALASAISRIPSAKFEELALATLPLALDRMEDHDYAEVIRLLSLIWTRVEKETKEKIADSLYPVGKPVNRLLAQVDHWFGKESLAVEQLGTFAEKVTSETKLQVQRVPKGTEPVKLPETTMVRHAPRGDEQIVVTMGSGLGIGILGRQRARLPLEAISEFLRAALVAIEDEDNVPRNRQQLLRQLFLFADRVEDSTRFELLKRLETIISRQPAAQKPLQVFGPRNVEWEMGSFDEVRSMALTCFAVYSNSDPQLSRKASELIEEASLDQSFEMRRGAYRAAGRLSRISDGVTLTMLMALRDPDPANAISAFAAFCLQPEWELSDGNWKLFLLAVRLAGDSPNSKLRRVATLALSRRMSLVPNEMQQKATDTLAGFAQDISFCVREAARDNDVDD